MYQSGTVNGYRKFELRLYNVNGTGNATYLLTRCAK